MLKSHAHTFRSRSRLAVGLSWVAGYTNAITLIAAGQTVSHQTGNVTHLGEALGHALVGGHGGAAEATYFTALIVAFGLGAFASGLITGAGRRSRFALPLTVEAILLAVVALLLRDGGDPHGVAPLIAALAMGLQNATITRISGAVVRTTHLTGVVTDLGLELSGLVAGLSDAVRAGRGRRAWRDAARRAGAQRALLLASIFTSFLIGAGGGTLLFGVAHAVALLLPVLFLTALVVREQLADVAEVRPADVPAEWTAVVPASVGLFHLVHRTTGRRHHPPDFTAWAERLDPRWRAAVLTLDPATRLHADAAINLLSAAALLRATGRTLVVAGLDRSQLRLLRHCDPHHRLKWQNFPPDLEFAVARAISVVEAGPAAADANPTVG